MVEEEEIVGGDEGRPIWPWLVAGAFIIAAVISPGTDMMSQIVMAIPMLGLYIFSIAIAFIFQKKRAPDAA